jgi:hypothetical protein
MTRLTLLLTFFRGCGGKEEVDKQKIFFPQAKLKLPLVCVNDFEVCGDFIIFMLI